jgi:zinc transport system ATP-binding protein
MYFLQEIRKDDKFEKNADIIICRNASFGYDGNIVIRDLNCSIRRGDYFFITGENGSGKSTLLKGLLRLINPLQGNIVFDAEMKKTEIGYLSQQDAAEKDFPAGAYEVVLSGNIGAMGLRPFYSGKEKRRAEENMARLGITGLKNRCYRELSGGQKRRVLLARSLCAAQKLLVLDEPLAGLDPVVTEEVYGILKKINEETGITIIMVSHNIDAVKKYASKILNFGRSLFDLNNNGGKKEENE